MVVERRKNMEKMQSPGMKEVSQICSHGCCPSNFFSSPENQNKDSKSKSTSQACRRDFASVTSSSFFPDSQFTNHECLPSLHHSDIQFTKAYPQYSDTYQVDQIRAREYFHLSFSNHTCLDYIGIGLFSYTQLHKQETSPSSQVASTSVSPLSLPRSSSSVPPLPLSPSSTLSHYSEMPFFSVTYKMGNLKTQLLNGGPESKLESGMRKRIMKFLNISENEYSLVFTANRTSAFKLLAESYPFKSSRKLLTVYDYESEAVESMMKTSEKKGAHVMSAEFSWPRLRINSTKLRKMIESKRKKKKKRGLFVFPVHSRMTGTRYPYLWMRIAQENGWHILIDACALGPKDMDSFGLSLFHPDFLVCSFYKIFGEIPSGFACLIVKKSTIPILEADKSTGMVSLLPAKKQFWLAEESKPTVTLQENKVSTTKYLPGPISIPSMQPGKLEQGESSSFIQREIGITNEDDESTEIECRSLDQVDSLGLITISNRARCLINWLVNALLKLQHPNIGNCLVRIYGPKIKFDRGPALAFNIFDWKGEKIEPVLVQKLADRSSISLSYGFLHHICFSDKYLKEKDKVLERKGGKTKGTAQTKGKDKTDLGIAVVTASLGFLANFEDTYRLWVFVAQFLDADYVEKARWRYTAANQKTIEV